MMEFLLAVAPGLPVLLAVLWPIGPLRRFLMAVAPWAALPALLLALVPGAVGTRLVAPELLLELQLELDGLGRAFLLLTAALWLAGGAFARAYHAQDPNRSAFFGFFVLTMAGNLGLVVAGDILTFYFFFAVMTFAAYGLVVHRRDAESRRAGRVYLVMAVAGELGILAGLFLLGWAVGGVPRFGAELGEAWAALSRGDAAGVGALLLLAGFGVKAGLVPLHLWLPLAHPVAPTAASALLSGSMIKAGLLAWLRFLPLDAALPLLGAGLMTVGVIAAFYGVVVGLAQDDPKTVLAYSSVSQMGYMAVGTGILVRAPEWAPAALFAVVLYALHHGVAKAGLFLSVGVADRVAGRAALVLGASALPALALSGAPLSSGARAKGALKGALEAFGGDWYPTLDPVLVAAAAGTALLMARFLVTLGARMRSGEPSTSAGSTGGGERTAHGPLPVGLVLPWALLLGLSVVAPLWMTRAYPAPPGIALPALAEGLATALAPLLFGAAVGWMFWRRPHLLGGLGSVRIPPGDLLVPVESAVGRCAGPFRRILAAPEAAAGRGPPIEALEPARRIRDAEPTGRPPDGEDGASAASDLRLAGGPVFGLLLVGLATALLLALL